LDKIEIKFKYGRRVKKKQWNKEIRNKLLEKLSRIVEYLFKYWNIHKI
jgi:hypothetical protein